MGSLLEAMIDTGCCGVFTGLSTGCPLVLWKKRKGPWRCDLFWE